MHLGYWADFGKQHGVGKLSARRKMNALECAGLPVNMISRRRKEKKKPMALMTWSESSTVMVATSAASECSVVPGGSRAAYLWRESVLLRPIRARGATTLG